jgi:hypothetical protein
MAIPGGISSGLKTYTLYYILYLFQVFCKQIQSLFEELGVESVTDTYGMLDLEALAGSEHYALLLKEVYAKIS